MARPARALHLPLHADIMFMAERLGRLLRKAYKAALEARRLRLGRRPASRHQPLVAEHKTEPRFFTWTADPDEIIAALPDASTEP